MMHVFMNDGLLGYWIVPKGLFVIHSFWKSAAWSLNDQRRNPDTTVDALFNALAFHILSEESTNESITCSIRVDDLFLSDFWHFNLFDFVALIR